MRLCPAQFGRKCVNCARYRGITDGYGSGERSLPTGVSVMAALAFRTSNSPQSDQDRGALLRLLDALAEWQMRHSHRVISRTQSASATISGVNQPSSGNERSNTSPCDR